MTRDGFNDSARLVPDVVRGIRAWRIGNDGSLISVSQQYRWQPGWNHAMCFGITHIPVSENGTHLGTPIAPICGCGFWAYWTTRGSHVAMGQAVGIVEGKGKALVGREGFRIEHARIVALVDPAAPRVRFRFPRRFLLVWCVCWAVWNLVLMGFAFADDEADAWAYAGLALLFAAMAVVNAFTRAATMKNKTVAKRYPGVPVYRSWAAALKDHPVERPAWAKDNPHHDL